MINISERAQKDECSRVILVDNEKAFDLIEWNYLFQVLKKFTFGDVFLNWLNLLYKDQVSVTEIEGE